MENEWMSERMIQRKITPSSVKVQESWGTFLDNMVSQKQPLVPSFSRQNSWCGF